MLFVRAFEATTVLEDETVDSFVDQFCYAGGDQLPSARKKRVFSNRELLDKDPAVPGEQVAARANRSDEDGAWILSNVLEFDSRNMVYIVQDEDDPSRVISLPVHEVKRLEDTSTHLRHGDKVLAVFPETTSFYRAVVAKNPKAPANINAMWDVVVRFEDDEDETGKNPARRYDSIAIIDRNSWHFADHEHCRVPARFVLRRSDVGEDSESEEDGN